MGETELDKLAGLHRFVEDTDLDEWRRRQVAARVDEDTRERRSRAAKKASTPEVRAKRSANAKRQYKDRAARERASAATAAMWADPARRAARVAHIQAYWRHKRERMAEKKAPLPIPVSHQPVSQHEMSLPDSAVNNMEVTGAALRAHREKLGLTIRQASALLGMTPGNLSYIENGRRRPTSRTADRLSAFVRVSTLDAPPQTGSQERSS